MAKDTKKEEKPNRISDYFSNTERAQGNELFRINNESIEFKTELTKNEIILINVLKFNDTLLESKGISGPYRNYYGGLMRLLVSKDRKGRTEYVEAISNKNITNSTTNLGAPANNAEPQKKRWFNW